MFELGLCKLVVVVVFNPSVCVELIHFEGAEILVPNTRPLVLRHGVRQRRRGERGKALELIHLVS